MNDLFSKILSAAVLATTGYSIYFFARDKKTPAPIAAPATPAVTTAKTATLTPAQEAEQLKKKQLLEAAAEEERKRKEAIAQKIVQLLNEAKELELKDMQSKAIDAALEILKLDPNYFEAFFIIISNEEEESKYVQLVENARRAAKSKQQEAMVNLISEKPSNSRLRYAVPAAHDCPSSEVWFWLFLAKYSNAAQKHNRAIEYSDKVLIDKRASDLDKASAYIIKAHALSNNPNENPEKIKKTFEQALEKYPNSTSALMGLASFYMATDMIKSKELIKRAEQINPNDVMVKNSSAHILVLEGKSDEAEVLFEECIKINPKAVDPYASLLSINTKRGDNKKALEILNRATKNGVEDILLDFAKLEVYFFTVNYTNFKNVCKKVISSDLVAPDQKQEIAFFADIVGTNEMLFQSNEKLRGVISTPAPWSETINTTLVPLLKQVEFSKQFLANEGERVQWVSWIRMLFFLSTAGTAAQINFVQNVAAFFELTMHPSQEPVLMLMTNMYVAWWFIDDIIHGEQKLFQEQWLEGITNFVAQSKNPTKDFMAKYIK